MPTGRIAWSPTVLHAADRPGRSSPAGSRSAPAPRGKCRARCSRAGTSSRPPSTWGWRAAAPPGVPEAGCAQQGLLKLQLHAQLRWRRWPPLAAGPAACGLSSGACARGPARAGAGQKRTSLCTTWAYMLTCFDMVPLKQQARAGFGHAGPRAAARQHTGRCRVALAQP